MHLEFTQDVSPMYIITRCTIKHSLLLTSRPQLNETVFGVSTRSKIQSRAFKKKELYDSDADFFGKTNGEIRNRLTFIV